MPSPSTISSRRRRDPLLDLWRGIALVDMAWVHLATYPIGMPDVFAAWIGEHTRFAAGCFVLLSGITVCRVFGPALESGGAARKKAVVRLLRRALLLAAIGQLAGMAFATIEWLARVPGDGGRGWLDSMLPLVSFAEPGATGSLLLLYSFLLAATPLLHRLRASAGDAATLLLSLSVFALAQALGEAAHWPPWAFPVAHWQPLFVAGYLASPHFDRLRAADGMVSLRWLASSTLAVTAVFVLRSGPALGIDATLIPAPAFKKVPLNTPELVWYAVSSAFVLGWSAWLYERSATARRATAWLKRLGQWSLLVYVSHLFLELPILSFLNAVDPPPFVRATMLLVMALGLGVVARVAEVVSARRPLAGTGASVRAFLRLALPPAGAVGSAVATTCAFAVWMLQAPAPGSDFLSVTGDVGFEEAAFEESVDLGAVVPAVGVVEEMSIDEGIDRSGDPDSGEPDQYSPSITLIEEMPDDDDPFPIAN